MNVSDAVDAILSLKLFLHTITDHLESLARERKDLTGGPLIAVPAMKTPNQREEEGPIGSGSGAFMRMVEMEIDSEYDGVLTTTPLSCRP